MLLSLQHMQIGVAQPIQPEIAPGINCDWDFLVISWIPNRHNDDKGTRIFFGKTYKLTATYQYKDKKPQC